MIQEKLEEAKRLYQTANADQRYVLESLFPELKESEEEKMWKLIKKYAHYNISDTALEVDHITREQLESWLEKQAGKDKLIQELGKYKVKYTQEILSQQLKKQGDKPQEKTALEAIHEEKVDNTNKVEPKFKVKYAGSEYNVLEVKDIAGVIFYGIEDEPNHIYYVKPENCEIISGYVIKENGSPYPTKPAVFSEQKPTDNTEPKFHEDEWITNGQYNKLIVGINSDWTYYIFEDGTSQHIKYIDKKYHLWTIEDAKSGDVLIDVYGNIGIYEECDDFDWMSYCSLGHNGGFQYFKVEHENEKTHPATKEQRDFLFQKMKESSYEWDAEKKELDKIEKQGEQKKSYDVCDSSMMDNKKSPYGEKRDFGYFEEKPADKVEPKFKVGDWIVSKTSNLVYRVDSILLPQSKCYYLSHNGGKVLVSFTDEQDYHLWTIQDAKVGDVLFSDLMCGKTFIYNGVNSDMAILYSFIISNDGDDVLPYHIGKPNTGIGTIEDNKNIIHPATKEQSDLLFQKMKELGYEWNIEKKEIKKIVEPNFKIGDWCIDNEDDTIFQIVKVLDNTYAYKTIEGKEYSCTHYSLENDARLWTIADAKDGDVLYSLDSKQPFIYKDRLQFSQARGYCCINKFGEFAVWYTSKCVICTDKYIPATKEQRDALFAKMKEAGYVWDAEKKELKKIEQSELTEFEDAVKDMMNAYRDAIGDNNVTTEEVKKHATYLLSLIPHKPIEWSEEDELRVKDTIYFLDTAKKHYASTVVLDACIDWIKSIKQRIGR